MYVWVFMGNLGEGKTFGMSVLAHYFASRARKAGLSVDIYANYGLLGSKPLINYKDIFNVANPTTVFVLWMKHTLTLTAGCFIEVQTSI